jgi:hypothetical protein
MGVAHSADYVYVPDSKAARGGMSRRAFVNSGKAAEATTLRFVATAAAASLVYAEIKGLAAQYEAMKNGTCK